MSFPLVTVSGGTEVYNRRLKTGVSARISEGESVRQV